MRREHKRREHLDKIGVLLGWVGLDVAAVLDEDKDGAFLDLTGRRVKLARLGVVRTTAAADADAEAVTAAPAADIPPQPEAMSDGQ